MKMMNPMQMLKGMGNPQQIIQGIMGNSQMMQNPMIKNVMGMAQKGDISGVEKPIPAYQVPNPNVYYGCGCNTGCGC